MKNIRVLALCIFSSNGRILAARGVDTTKNEVFYRPFGGGVEFGETAVAAVKREIAEELDKKITEPSLISVRENIFTFNGKIGHEIVFIFDANFVDDSIYRAATVEGIEEDKKLELVGSWISISDILAGNVTVYPRGIEIALQAKFGA